MISFLKKPVIIKRICLGYPSGMRKIKSHHVRKTANHLALRPQEANSQPPAPPPVPAPQPHSRPHGSAAAGSAPFWSCSAASQGPGFCSGLLVPWKPRAPWFGPPAQEARGGGRCLPTGRTPGRKAGPLPLPALKDHTAHRHGDRALRSLRVGASCGATSATIFICPFPAPHKP